MGPQETPNPPAAIVVASGDQQVRFPGTVLLASIVVQVVDAGGEPTAVSGLAVTWRVTVGGGAVSGGDTTDGFGIWRAAFTLGPDTGANAVEVTVSDLAPAVISARATEPGPIAFISNRRAGFTGNDVAGFPGDLYVMNEDGSDVILLALSNRPFEYASHPAWRPDGREILYNLVEPRPAGGTPGAVLLGIFATDPTGRTQRKIPAGPDPAFAVQLREPRWAPDGRTILAHRMDTERLFTFASSGTDFREVAIAAGRSADWSPVSDRFVYVCGGSICAADRDGQNGEQLTSGGLDGEPVWSPDGTRVLFSRDSTGAGGIWLVNADGSDARQVLDGAATAPAWSPDGTRFAASVRDGNGADLWIVTLLTGHAENITASRWIDRQPDWRKTAVP